MKKRLIFIILTLFFSITYSDGHIDFISEILPISNSQFLTMSYDKNIIISSLENKDIEKIYLKNFFPISFDLSNNQKICSFGSLNGEVFLFDLKNKKILKKINTGNGNILNILFLNNNEFLINTSEKKLIIYDIKNSYQKKLIYISSIVTNLYYSKSLNTISIGCLNGNIYLLRADSLKTYFNIKTNDTKINDIYFENNILISIGSKNNINKYIFNDELLTDKFEENLDFELNSIDVYKNFILCSSSDGYVNIFDLKNLNLLFRIKGHEGKVTKALFLNDGKNIVSIGEDSNIVYYDFEKKEIIKKLNGK